MVKGSKIHIVADEKIPFVETVFSHISDLTLLPGRSISQEHLKYADLLLTRSITRVNRNLLETSRVKMVASATIGADHVDLQYLNSHDIQFALATGGNAKSVAEYVVAAILEFAVKKYDKSLNNLSLGIVGVGNIGRLVARMAEGLGLKVLENDPPLAEKTNGKSYLPLAEIVKCDIVTIHVPLTKSGPTKTLHLFDEELLAELQPGSLLINTSRGAVVDDLALKEALTNKKITAAVLDVWENEPNIDIKLLNQVFIATPHIAGYSLDGKANCTGIIYRKVCEYFGFTPKWKPHDSLPEPDNTQLEYTDSNLSDLEFLHKIVKNTYDIKKDDTRTRSKLIESGINVATEFDRLRNDYPIRREFRNYQIEVQRTRKWLLPKLQALGFRLKT